MKSEKISTGHVGHIASPSALSVRASVADHTPTPWPEPDQPMFFTGVGGTESVLKAGILSLSDYLRARACVNACGGMDDPVQAIAQLRNHSEYWQQEANAYRAGQGGLNGEIRALRASNASLAARNAELEAALRKCLAAFEKVPPQGQPLDSEIGRACCDGEAALNLNKGPRS